VLHEVNFQMSQHALKMSRCCPTFSGLCGPFCGSPCSAEHAEPPLLLATVGQIEIIQQTQKWCELFTVQE